MRISLLPFTQPWLHKTVECSWSELVARLTSYTETECDPCPGHECPAKKGETFGGKQNSWSPAICAEGENHTNDNVQSLELLVFDLDDVKEDVLDALLNRLQADGLAILATSSHSHSDQEIRLRLVLRPSRPVAKHEIRKARAACEKLYGIPSDAKTKDERRLYFLPTHPKGRKPWTLAVAGKPVDVDRLLAEVVPVASKPAPKSVEIPAIPEALPVDRKEILDGLKRGAKGTPAWARILSLIIKGESIAPWGEHDASLLQLAGLCAHHTDASLPDEVLFDLFDRSFRVLDWGLRDHPVGGDSERLADLQEAFRQKLERERQRTEEHREQKKAAALEFQRKLGFLHRREARAKAEGVSVDKLPDEEDSGAWCDQFPFLTTENGAPKGCGPNVGLCFAHAPEWKGAFRLNKHKGITEVWGGPLHDGPPIPLTDSHVVDVTNWFAFSDYGLLIKPGEMLGQIEAAAEHNAYDPLLEFVRGLPEWDGVPRVHTLFTVYCNADTTLPGGKDIKSYVELAADYFMRGVYARAARPGCKLDTFPILTGKQGRRKSSVAEALVGEEFVSEPNLDLSSKDSQIIAGSCWLVELSELDALTKSQVTQQKSFISKRMDTFRPPYGKKPVTVPRRCAFVGTTNRDDYLQDPTGNRRYWPVRVGECDIDAIRRDRLQLWAEAKVMFEAGAQWWFTPEEQELANLVTEQHSESDVVAEAITDLILSKAAKDRPKELRTSDLCREIFGDQGLGRAEQTRIGNAAHGLGFEKVMRERGGKRFSVYLVPQSFLEAPAELPRKKLSGFNPTPKKEAQ